MQKNAWQIKCEQLFNNNKECVVFEIEKISRPSFVGHIRFNFLGGVIKNFQVEETKIPRKPLQKEEVVYADKA